MTQTVINYTYPETPYQTLPVVYDEGSQNFYTIDGGVTSKVVQETFDTSAAALLSQEDINRLYEIIDWFQKEHRPEELL